MYARSSYLHCICEFDSLTHLTQPPPLSIPYNQSYLILVSSLQTLTQFTLLANQHHADSVKEDHKARAAGMEQSALKTVISSVKKS